jgi:Pyruvate/2-oxoacid:ferredoxin oxidoreductase gamma subunit
VEFFAATNALLFQLARTAFGLDVSVRDQIMIERQQAVTVVHIRFEGRSLDIPQGDLDVGLASSDSEIKRALARYLEVSEAKLRDYVIDRHDTGNLTVRPEAVFG